MFLLVATTGLVLTQGPNLAPETGLAACPDVPEICGPDFQVAAIAWDRPDRVQLNVVVREPPSRARIEDIFRQLAHARPGKSIVAFMFDESIGPERYGFRVEVAWQGSGQFPAVANPAEEESWVATDSVIPGSAPRLFWGPAAPGT